MVVVNDFGGSVHGQGGSSTAADEVCDQIVKGGGLAMPNYESVVNPDQLLQPIIKGLVCINYPLWKICYMYLNYMYVTSMHLNCNNYNNGSKLPTLQYGFLASGFGPVL